MNQGNASSLMDMILMIAWSIWRNRNEVRHGGRNMSAAEIYGMTNRLLQEYTVTQEIPHQLQITQSAQHRWVPLPNGWYKVNANGGCFFETQMDWNWCGSKRQPRLGGCCHE